MSQKPLIVVVGETILDVDYTIMPSTQSPDGFPVYRQPQSGANYRFGGAAAVAGMVEELGGDVRLVTNIDGPRMGIPPGANGPWAWDAVASTKRRYVVSGRVAFRIDTDVQITRVPLSVFDAIRQECTGRQVYLILSDYGKGMFDQWLWAHAIRASVKPVESFGDPHRSRSSMVEASELLGRCTVLAQGTQDPYWHAGLSERKLNKRGHNGMMLFDDLGAYEWSPRNFGMDPTTAVDTCGCGDMAIAALAVARSEGLRWNDALKFAVAAAAEEALVWGAVPVSRSVVDARLKRG